jgi:phospholipase/lecithinase/hemolysin
VVDRCWTGDYDGTGGALCADPDRYFLFDSVHPSAVVHRATGLAMAAAVPEPQALALLLAGLGVAAVGAARARRPVFAG